MFNKSKNRNNQDSATPVQQISGGSSNSIVAGTTIVGDITANNDIRIDGMLEGTLDCQGRVIVGPTGSIHGKITCTNAVIEGKFKGNLIVKEQLSVKDSAEISGDIKTDKLIVQSGAVFNVSCNMGGQIIKSFEVQDKEEQAPLSFSK